MANSSEGLDNLSTMFEWRCLEIWGIHEDGRSEEAEISACELLMEPRLGSLHRASLHLLLAGSPNEYVEHAKEAVRLYTEVKQQFQDTFSPEQKANMEKMIDAAKAMLHKARTDQNAINRQIEEALAAGYTMKDFHDAQIEEMMGLRRHDEPGPVPPPSSNNEPGPVPPSSSNEPGIALPSSRTVIEPDAGDSQRTQVIDQSQPTGTDFDDDTSPFPAIR